MMNFLRKQMKWVMAIIVVAFLLSTFLMYEGRGTRRTPTRNADGTMSDYEVAQINGRSLMRSELETRLRNYLSNYSSRTTASLDMAALYQTVLDQAVLDSQLAKEVEEQGIRISDAEADMAMKNYADTYYPTRETFYQVLAQSGIKVDDYKKTLARQMAVDTLLQNAIGNIEISEDRAVEFYDTMKGLIYSTPEGFMIHMADFNNNAAAETFRTRIVNGESWDVIASNDDIPSADVINITRAPVFLPSSSFTTGTLTALNSVDISEPTPVFEVASEDYAVAIKASHVDESVRPYEEVSADIKTLLTQQEQRKRLSDYEEELKSKANLVINDKDLFARPEVSADETPQFSIDDITLEEVSTDEEAKSEIEVIDVSEEVKEEIQEEAKPEETPETPEPVTEVEPAAEPEKVEEVAVETPTAEVVEEVKETEPEVVEPAKVEEEATVAEAAPEKAEEPVAPAEEPAKEEAPAVVEEVKEEIKDEAKSEETPETPAPVAEVEEPVTEEKAPEVEPTVEPEKVEEVVTEEATPAAEEVVEEVKEVKEEKPEVEEAVKVEEKATVTEATPEKAEEPVAPAEEPAKEEAPAVVEEVKEEIKEEAKTEETPEAPAPVAEVEEAVTEAAPEVVEVTKSEDMPLQEKVEGAIKEAVTELVEKVEEAVKE